MMTDNFVSGNNHLMRRRVTFIRLSDCQLSDVSMEFEVFGNRLVSNISYLPETPSKNTTEYIRRQREIDDSSIL